MDKETKEYIDSKFAGLEVGQKQGVEAYARRKKLVQKIVAVCSAILLVLCGFLFYLLYQYQLRGFFQ